MDFQLTGQQRRMVAAVRELAQGEFKANAQKYMDGTFPWENMRKLAEIGVLGMSVPEEYGGLGLAVFDTALLLEEIAKTCYVTAMATLGEAGVQTRVIATYAPESIRKRILPKVVSGDCMLAVCMTEPHAGTDVANYRTNAVIKGDRVILNGTKTLISRAREAGMFVIFTRIDGKAGREGIGCVLLEPDTHRLRGDRDLSHHGWREPARDPVQQLRIAAGESGDPRGRLSQAAQRFQHAALSQPEHFAGARRGRVRRSAQLCQGPHGVRQSRSAFIRACAGSSPRCTARSRRRAASSIAPA